MEAGAGAGSSALRTLVQGTIRDAPECVHVGVEIGRRT